MKRFIIRLINIVAELYALLFGKEESRAIIFHNIEIEDIDAFERQIHYISENFDESITASQFSRLCKNKELNKKKYICITFDDGFSTVITNALPILKKYHLTATIFINHNLHLFTEFNNRVELDNFVKKVFWKMSDGYEYKGLKKKDIEYLINEGFEIGGHTITHSNSATIPINTFENEIKFQKQYFLNEFSYEITSFAYPFGKSREISTKLFSILDDSNYLSAFTGISFDYNKVKSQYFLPRTNIPLKISFRRFKLLLKGSSAFKDFITFQSAK